MSATHPSSAAAATSSTACPSPSSRRLRVAVVVQRYGVGAVGGAEWHAQALVQELREHHDITVLTSCARDAASWAMVMPPGVATEAGLPVWRFAHPQRNADGRARVPLRHKWRMLLGSFFDRLERPRVAAPSGEARLDGEDFLRRQGPFCPDLIQALHAARDDFDAIVFVTALYYPTAIGLPAWGRRSVLIPTLHDEKPMYLPCFHRVFAAAGEVLYNTRSEQELARRLYGASASAGRVVGAGVKVRQPLSEEVSAVRLRHRLSTPYLVYVGRIEKGKGCGDLLSAWKQLEGRTGDAVLVFVGKGALPIEPSARVRVTGFVPDDERDALMAGAAALVMPSRFESLSLVLLEALALGVPVLVNGRCDVLAEHARHSGAGESYHSPSELRRGLRRALERSATEREKLGQAGLNYVARHYGWPQVAAAWLEAIERVSRQPLDTSPGAAPSQV